MEMTILAMSALGFIAAVVAPRADVSFGSAAAGQPLPADRRQADP
jgi:hypothetical protein